MDQIGPYGSWASPVDVELVAELDAQPGWVSRDGSVTWWVQPMPAEGGRLALTRTRDVGFEEHGFDSDLADIDALDDEVTEVVLPAPWNVRNRVHEYGGRPYVLVPGREDTAVIFTEYSDQRLYWYEQESDDMPRPLTPAPARLAGLRYAEPVLSPDGREVWCVLEEHTGPLPTDVTRAIVAVPLSGAAADDPSAVRVLVHDRHFLACPRPSPDGRLLSWIGWDHPNMPWDSTELRVAPIAADGSVGAAATVAGGPDEAVVQAEWKSADSLLLSTDRTGWWNLHEVSLDSEGQAVGAPVNLCPREEEFGGPLWVLGLRWFTVLADGRVAVIHGRESTRLSVLDTDTGLLDDLGGADHTEWWPTLASSGRLVWGVAAAPDTPPQIVMLGGRVLSPLVIAEPSMQAVGAARYRPVSAAVPGPDARTFTGPSGREVYANVYPPFNRMFAGPAGVAAPYVVFVHGGPTSRAPMVLDLEVAFFTSRGIGVVEVNYGGSTGHGREYRNRLRENWGVVDVEDCVAVAQGLVAEGLADPARLGIRGGSAGGWTAAAALTFSDVFACGVIRYPILDLAGWRSGETHDFESQYLDSLVGPWPQTADRYRERSPINHAEMITAPFLLLQGLEDEICPPVQCERFVELIAGRGTRHAYLTFDGEQHGFRRKETIVAALEAELALYAQVFGFTPDDDLPKLVLTS